MQHERCFTQDLRPIQIREPDVDAPGFRKEAHRQTQAVAASPYEDDEQAFIDAISALDIGGNDE